MAYAADLEQITLSGPPQYLQAVIQNFPVEKGMISVTLTIGRETGIHRALLRPLGRSNSELLLKLPPQTAPGSYRGDADFDGDANSGAKRRPIMVEIEPVTQLMLHPEQTTLEAGPASKSEFNLLIVNLGNVPVDIPESSTFDLDDEQAQDGALGRSLRAKLPQGEQRVDRFFEELRVSHGGEARVLVRAGAGSLAPGESRTLQCTLVAPDMIQAGRSYSGDWPLGNTAHIIAVTAAKTAPRNSEGTSNG